MKPKLLTFTKAFDALVEMSTFNKGAIVNVQAGGGDLSSDIFVHQINATIVVRDSGGESIPNSPNGGTITFASSSVQNVVFPFINGKRFDYNSRVNTLKFLKLSFENNGMSIDTTEVVNCTVYVSIFYELAENLNSRLPA